MHRRNKSKKIFLIITIFIIVCLVLIGTSIIHYFPAVKTMVLHQGIELKQTNGKTNILLLGIGGGVHDGPNLSDTIIFASLDPKAKRATLISIPRDLWVPDFAGKINTAYAIGQLKNPPIGLSKAKLVIGNILKQPIHYGFRIDFSGFTKAVNEVGGLDIQIDRTFDDYQYPLEENATDLCGHSLDEATALIATQEAQVVFPCRYEHVHFEKGLEHMDGERALIFVRSRYASGPEGTDFARSKRQEKVLTAFKNKVFSLQTFLNPVKVISLYHILQDSIDTDIKQEEIGNFLSLAKNMKDAKIQNFVIDFGDETTGRPGLLIHPDISTEYGNQWVLSPRTGNGNFAEIQKYAACILSYKTCVVKKQ